MGARYTHATKSLNETQHSHWDNGEFHNIASGVIAKRIGELYSVCMICRFFNPATQIPHCQHVCASTSRKSRLRGSCVSSQFRLLNCR